MTTTSDWPVITEATLERSEHGVAPASGGWFVMNLADVKADCEPGRHYHANFQGVQNFPDYGINVQTLYPGVANCMYHREAAQESILVLSGTCMLVVEGQERPLAVWDFVHLPPGTAHVVVGTGEAPCSFLMVGARPDNNRIIYEPDAAAAKYDACVATTTTSPDEAYADEDEPVSVQLPWTHVVS